MASRIAVMSQGRVLQVGTPQEIYESPNCRFVADFIGNVNLFDGTLEPVAAGHADVRTPEGLIRLQVPAGQTRGSAVGVAIRPEKIHLARLRPEQSHNVFSGQVRELAYFGSYSSFRVDLPSGKSVRITQGNAERQEQHPIVAGDQVFVWWGDASAVLLTH